MAISQKQARISNELSALGYSLVKEYVIFDEWGNVQGSFQTLDAVDRWLGKEEQRRLDDAGGALD